jgi:diguanylate cyclase (GGDEF)-like protein/PAS domain S-box-containing protein
MVDHSRVTEPDILDSLFEGAYRVDRERRIVYWNPAAEKLTGFAASEVLGSFCADGILRHVDDKGCVLCLGGCPLARTMDDGAAREARVFLHHKLGHRVPVSVRSTPVRSADGEITGGLELFTGTSASEVLEQRIRELEELAFLDPLTQLANRRFAEVTLGQRLEEHRRHGWPFGAILFDIDDFKLVNDRFGHGAGDKTLQMVATTLALNARSFDVVARWGGDELLILIRNVDRALLTQVGERFRTLVGAAFLTAGDDTIAVTLSGGATTVRGGDTAESVVARADRLLYESKVAGSNRLTIDPDIS